MRKTSLLPLLLTCSAIACRGPTPVTECPQVPVVAANTVSAPAEKLGILSQETRDMVLKTPSVGEMELLVDPNGRVWKVYAEHKAGTPVPPGLQQEATKLWPGFTDAEYVTENTAQYGRVSILSIKNAAGDKCKLAVEEGSSKTVYTQCKMATEKLPQFIRDLGKAKFPDGEMAGGGRREFVGGNTEYWLNVKTAGVEHFIQYTSDQKPVRHGVWYEGEIMLELPM